MCDLEFVRQMKERSPQGNDTICVSASSSGARSETKFSEGIYLQTFKAFSLTNAGSCYVKGIINGVSQRTFIKEEVRTSFCVDDLLLGASNIQDAVRLCHTFRNVMKQAGMTLRKWTANNGTTASSSTRRSQKL